MKKIILTFFIIISAIGYVQSDSLDITAEVEQLKEYDLLTIEQVYSLDNAAFVLFNEKKYEEALEALIEVSKQANYLSNIIRRGIEPYYSANYDDRKGYTKVRNLAVYEKKSNEFIKMRNKAIVFQAKCYINLGDEKSALPLLMKALDLIDLDNDYMWTKARILLYEIIEYDE
jgi:tetratricopeptide (TPR) repeat protein